MFFEMQNCKRGGREEKGIRCWMLARGLWIEGGRIGMMVAAATTAS